MVKLYICISLVLILVAQIITEYERSAIGGIPFIRSCGFIITWLSAGILLGTLVKCVVNPEITKGMRLRKRGLP